MFCCDTLQVKEIKWSNESNKKSNLQMQALEDSESETNRKNLEFEESKNFINLLKEKANQLLNKMDKTKRCQEILEKGGDARIIRQEINEIDPDYLRIKDELDDLLINEIKRELLDTTVECCFAGYEKLKFKYPKVFYLLDGHYLEKIVCDLFFNNDKNESNENKENSYKPLALKKEILKDDGIMSVCGNLVPNELKEIFNRIDGYKMSELKKKKKKKKTHDDFY